jgi:hypothetical protein
MTPTGFVTHHLNLPKEDSDLFKRMKEKTRSRSYAQTLTAALRALELQEAHRDKEVKGV